MKNTAWLVTFIIAAVALGCSLVAVSVSATVATRPAPPLGVCVLASEAFADTSVIADVSQPQRVNGVITCKVGEYVPVTPEGN